MSEFISLLYPSEESRLYHANAAHLPKIGEKVAEELGLTEIFNLKSGKLSNFFTADEAVIRYREATFREIEKNPSLLEVLKEVRPILQDITELQMLDRESEEKDAYLYSITAIELYVSAVDVLKKGLTPLADTLAGGAFLGLYERIDALCASDYFIELRKKLDDLASHVHDIKSVTVGVNLDAEFRPTDAGVLSVNSEPFRSGKTLDKILRLSFKNDAFTTISPLVVADRGDSDNRTEAMNGAFRDAIAAVNRQSIKGWRAIVGEYVLDSADFLLTLLPEIELVIRSAELIEKLKNHPGCALSYPVIAPMGDRTFRAEGLFNPRVALAIDDEIVTNDINFDENGKIYVLTGPNRGGKSVITVAVGAAQAMFQLGLPVPAKTAALSVADGIFTHFPEGADDTIDKGRLGEECQRLRDIFREVTKNSLILLDESLSSTGAYEASYIASELLVAFAAAGCRGIFSTHLHELAAKVAEINERAAAFGGVKIDTLVAGMEKGQRSFLIKRQKPDGKSYARDIAEKYGLSLDRLIPNGSAGESETTK